MPTQKYRLADGTIIPGVTTIIGNNLGWKSGALMYWAWEQGMEGKNFRESTKEAADAGTVAHALAEADIKGLQATIPPGTSEAILAKANSAFEAYRSWKEMTKIELLESESPYVSESHRYGGTIDALGTVNGKRVLVDFKTSNGLYPDHIIQVAAYTYLWEENHGERLDGGIHILRFSKEGGDFHHHFYPRARVDDPFHAFLHLRALSDLKKPIEGMT